MEFRSIQYHWWRHRRGASAVLLIFTIALPFVLVARFKKEQSVPQSLLEGVGEDEEEPFDRFRLRNVSWESFDDKDQERLSAKAEKIIHRNRRTQFFSYANLKEIDLFGLQVDLHQRKQTLRDSHGLLSSSFKEIGDLGLAMLGLPSAVSEASLANLDTGSEILTRVAVEKLRLTVHLSTETTVVLSSERTLINFGGVTFQDAFSLTDADGKRLDAPLAIYVKDSDRIYVPDGYVFQAEEKSQKGTAAVFLVDSSGNLVQSQEQPSEDISGLDWLDEAEATFQNLFLGELVRCLGPLEDILPEALIPLAGQRFHKGDC